MSFGEKDCCSQRARNRGEADTCPRCGAPGRVVAEETVATILRRADAALFAGAETRFCATRDCPVVYYTRHGRVAEKAAAVIRVGAKEMRDPVPLCYCFGFSRADVYREVASTGTSTIPERIEAEIRAGRCACRRKNPSGTCCLGDVRKAVGEAKATLAKGDETMTIGSDQDAITRSLQVGIYVYEDAEVLDFAAPYEVFSTASRVHARMAPGDPPPFVVSLIAETRRPVAARAGFVVQPRFSIKDHPPLDILVVAGGVHAAEMAKDRVISWIARQHETTRLTASVCTGSFLLARAAVLADGEVTTHWEDCADLAREFPSIAVRSDQRWTEQGRVMTSAGISAGLDMSLRIVERFAGEGLAARTARHIDYPWRRTP